MRKTGASKTITTKKRYGESTLCVEETWMRYPVVMMHKEMNSATTAPKTT